MNNESSVSSELAKARSSMLTTLYEAAAKDIVAADIRESIRLTHKYDSRVVDAISAETGLNIINGSAASNTGHGRQAVGREIATYRVLKAAKAHMNKRTLVVSPSAMELRFFGDKVTYLIGHWETKDYKRLAAAVRAKLQGYKTLKAKATVVEEVMRKMDREEVSLIAAMQFMGMDAVTEIDRKYNTIVALDCFYEADEDQIRDMAVKSGATFWLATMWLPIELVNTDVFEAREYRLLDGPKGTVEVMWKTGESGYSHDRANWAKWAKQTVMGGVAFELVSAAADVYYMVGAPAVGSLVVNRMFTVPDQRRKVGVLDINRVYDYKTHKIKRAERLTESDYIDMPWHVVEESIKIVSAFDNEKDRTVATLFNFMRKRQMTSRNDCTFGHLWHIDSGQMLALAMAVIVHAKSSLHEEQIEAAEDEQGKARRSLWERAVRAAMLPITWPIDKFTDFLRMLMSQERNNILFRNYSPETVHRSTHSSAKRRVEDITLGKLSDYLETSTTKDETCAICSEVKDPGEQKVICEHYGYNTTHNFEFSDAMRNDLRMNKLIPDPKAPDNALSRTFAAAAEKLPQPAIRTVPVHFIIGPPGTGKSWWARAAIVKSRDAMVVPFKKLLSDYSDDKAITVYTQHKALAKLQVVDTLYVDEYTALDYVLLCALVIKTNCKRVMLIGDAKQTGIMADEGVNIKLHIMEEMHSRMTLQVNFRNPGNIVRHMNSFAGYNMIPMKEDQIVQKCHVSEIPEDYVQISFSGASSEEEGTSTSRSNQGSTHKKVALKILEDDVSLSRKDSLYIVALTRHSEVCILVHDDSEKSKQRCDEILEALKHGMDAKPLKAARKEKSSNIEDYMMATLPAKPGPVHEAYEITDRTVHNLLRAASEVEGDREMELDELFAGLNLSSAKLLALTNGDGSALNRVREATITAIVEGQRDWKGPDNAVRTQMDVLKTSIDVETDFVYCDYDCDDLVLQDRVQAAALHFARLIGAAHIVKVKVLGPWTVKTLASDDKVLRCRKSDPLASTVYVTTVHHGDRCVPLARAWGNIEGHYALVRAMGVYHAAAPELSARLLDLVDKSGEKWTFKAVPEVCLNIGTCSLQTRLTQVDYDFVDKGVEIDVNLNRAEAVIRRLMAEGRKVRPVETVKQKSIKATVGALVNANRFFGDSEKQEIACMLDRYVKVENTRKCTNGYELAWKMALRLWEKQGKPEINETHLAHALSEVEEKNAERKYEDRMQSDVDYSPHNVFFRIKESAKVKSKVADPDKVSQGVCGRPSNHWLQFATFARAMAESIEASTGNPIITHHGRSDEQVAREFGEKLSKLTGCVDLIYLDQTTSDAMQNWFTQAIEAAYMLMCKWPEYLISQYFESRTDFLILGKKATAVGDDSKTSGDVLTLQNNNIVTGAVLLWLVRHVGENVVGVTGDDGAMAGYNISIDEDAKAEVLKHFPMKLKVEQGHSIEFCGKMITAKGVTINLPLRVIKLLGGMPRERKDVEQWRAAARDMVRTVESLGYEAYIDIMVGGGWTRDQAEEWMNLAKRFNATPIKALLQNYKTYTIRSDEFMPVETAAVKDDLVLAEALIRKVSGIVSKYVSDDGARVKAISEASLEFGYRKVEQYIWNMVNEAVGFDVRMVFDMIKKASVGDLKGSVGDTTRRLAFEVFVKSVGSFFSYSITGTNGLTHKKFYDIILEVVKARKPSKSLEEIMNCW